MGCVNVKTTNPYSLSIEGLREKKLNGYTKIYNSR